MKRYLIWSIHGPYGATTAAACCWHNNSPTWTVNDGYSVSLDSLSGKHESKRSYLHFFFSYRCRKGLNQMSAWAQNCLPSTIQQPHTHTPPRLSNRKNNSFSLYAPIPPQSSIPRGNPIHYVWAMHLFSSHFTTERLLSSWATPESTTETESIEINVFPSWFKFIIYGQWYAIFLNRDCSLKGQCGTFAKLNTVSKTFSFNKRTVV